MTLTHSATILGGAAGSLALFFAPGAWVSFGLPLRRVPFWARLLAAVALSPLVVCGEFFLVRWAGVPFAAAAVALVVVNLPGLYLIFRNHPLQLPSRAALMVGLSVALPCIVLMAPALISVGFRIYSPHAWVYSDPVYMFARGDLMLGDPYLAGIRMSYPVWPAMAFQALVSFLLDSPPASSWVWSNLACLMVICGFAVGITKELGGGRLAQSATSLWLMLGTNPVGYILLISLPGMTGRHLFGDLRYAAWVLKFHLFSTMPMGMALIAAMLYLLVIIDRPDTPELITLALLLGGAGFLYPLVLLPACGVFGAKMVAILLDGRETSLRPLLWRLSPLALVLAVSLLACYAEVKVLQHARQTGAAFLLSAPSAFARKAVVSVIAMSLLLLGLPVVYRRCWSKRSSAMAVLLVGALACAVLHSALAIPFWDNEYKFVFIMSMCLACFPALATEQLWRRLSPMRASATLLVLAGLLTLPYLQLVYGRPAPDPGPVDTTGFYLRLKPGETWSAMCQAVRTMTPPNAMLVAQSSDVYFPAFTGRDLYVPFADRYFPGVTLRADVLTADIRGNGRAILADRRQVLNSLYAEPASSTTREASLKQLLSVGKPVAIIVEPRHGGLLAWLRNSGRGTELYQVDGKSLWLIR